MVDLTDMTKEELLDFVQGLSDEELDNLDEDSKELITAVLGEEDETEDEESIDESAASETLKPGGGSKAEMLSTFTSLLSQLGKEDLSKFFDQAQSLFGPNKAPGATDKSGSNEATIKAKGSAAKGTSAIAPMPMPKLSVKEDIDEIFANDDTLTEDFREKASVIFEAALNTRINLEYARLAEELEAKEAELEEAFETKFNESVDDFTTQLTEKIDQYMSYCVEEWMEENKLELETSLRTEIAENFMKSLQNVFAEHYIEVPESRIDLVAELKAEVDELKTKLTETLDEKLTLESTLVDSAKETVFEEVSDGLAATQAEKLKVLAEGLEYTDTDSFKRKLEIIRENYFSDKKVSNDTGLITESIDGTDDTTVETYTAPHMNKYVQAIAKSVK